MPLKKLIRESFLFIVTVLGCFSTFAQDLDPRAYLRIPVGTTTAFTGVSLSGGEVVTDPSISIDNIKANVQSLSFGASYTFNILGKTSQALIILPYSWAQVSGDVREQFQKISRSGLADMRFRITTLLIGGDAGTLQEIMETPKKTIVGFGLTTIAPSGQFFSDKLINLGTNRWSFKPELGISQPLGRRWQLDFYSGVWLFTKNTSFYPGNAVRSQNPLGAFQAHISYNITPLLWIAFDATYYLGGKSSVDSTFNDDRQDNSRVGITLVVPTGKLSSLKLATSVGAVVRNGQDFTTLSLGWQKSWLKGFKK